MKIPNNKNIILFLDSRKRKFKTSNTLQEICQLVTNTIGHWMVTVFNLWPFCDQKHKVKSWGSLTDNSDLLCEKVVDVYDQNIPTVAFWSLATSPGHVGIQCGNLMWHKIQPGPIRCLYGPSPLIQPIYIFFYEFFVSFMDQAQHCSLFIFGPWPFCLNSFIFSFFINWVH